MHFAHFFSFCFATCLNDIVRVHVASCLRLVQTDMANCTCVRMDLTKIRRCTRGGKLDGTEFWTFSRLNIAKNRRQTTRTIFKWPTTAVAGLGKEVLGDEIENISLKPRWDKQTRCMMAFREPGKKKMGMKMKIWCTSQRTKDTRFVRENIYSAVAVDLAWMGRCECETKKAFVAANRIVGCWLGRSVVLNMR